MSNLYDDTYVIPPPSYTAPSVYTNWVTQSTHDNSKKLIFIHFNESNVPFKENGNIKSYIINLINQHHYKHYKYKQQQCIISAFNCKPKVTKATFTFPIITAKCMVYYMINLCSYAKYCISPLEHTSDSKVTQTEINKFNKHCIKNYNRVYDIIGYLLTSAKNNDMSNIDDCKVLDELHKSLNYKSISKDIEKYKKIYNHTVQILLEYSKKTTNTYGIIIEELINFKSNDLDDIQLFISYIGNTTMNHILDEGLNWLLDKSIPIMYVVVGRSTGGIIEKMKHTNMHIDVYNIDVPEDLNKIDTDETSKLAEIYNPKPEILID